MTERRCREAQIEYRLVNASNGRSATAQTKRWRPFSFVYVVDGLDPDSYSEFIAYRASDAGQLNEEHAIAFVHKLFPGNPDAKANIFDQRAGRLANIAVVRPTHLFRKAVSSEPIASGPPDGRSNPTATA